VNTDKVSNLTKASLPIYDASIGQNSLQPLDALVRNVGFVDVELLEVLHVCQEGNGPVGDLSVVQPEFLQVEQTFQMLDTFIRYFGFT
jgi:hypothetical protein